MTGEEKGLKPVRIELLFEYPYPYWTLLIDDDAVILQVRKEFNKTAAFLFLAVDKWREVGVDQCATVVEAAAAAAAMVNNRYTERNCCCCFYYYRDWRTEEGDLPA
jgi:hypothetical protein